MDRRTNTGRIDFFFQYRKLVLYPKATIFGNKKFNIK